jgi:magnesium-transporting ATPase (P-type)
VRFSSSRRRFTCSSSQFRSPLLLLLVFAAAASALTGEWADASIVLLIVAGTAGTGYSREYSAETAAAALGARLRTHTTVLRDSSTASVPAEEIVPGDVLLLSAGSLVPADCVILQATDCFVSEAVLTGESFPAEKRPGALPRAAPLSTRANCMFLGTNVRSGTARCLVVATGRGTQFGEIAHHLTLRPPDTEFDRGLRRFGYSRPLPGRVSTRHRSVFRRRSTARNSTAPGWHSSKKSMPIGADKEFRVIAVAVRGMAGKTACGRDDEHDAFCWFRDISRSA